MISLGELAGLPCIVATNVSPDGLVVVGLAQSIDQLTVQAFMWTQQAGIVGLGQVPGSNVSIATGVSTGGSVVVGHYFGNYLGRTAFHGFVWDAMHGMRPLAKALTDAGVNLDGWDPGAALVSADGQVVSGLAQLVVGRASGPNELSVARLP